MVSKNDKRLCWNCDGCVPFELTQCPYCGVQIETDNVEDDPKTTPEVATAEYSFSATDEEWDMAIEKKEENQEETSERKISTSLLLILPGATFALFGLLLLLFSKNGTLILHWKTSVAYFYFFGAALLLALGWRMLKKKA